jgi:lysophospholipase L1-like esterase
VSKISEIDKNFNVDDGLDLSDVKYYSVKENPWCLYGLMFDDVFRRMPKMVAENVNEGVLALHTNTSGGRLRFVTDSPYVAIVAKMPDKVHFPHMPQTGVTGFDMYIDNRFHSAFIPPIDMENSFSSVNYFENSTERNITINFPLYNNVTDLYIGLKEGASFKKAQDYERKEKIVYYGSSITQGGCASRPGLAYPAIISNELGCDYINLGFSGSARGEVIMAEYIASLEPDIFVMDYDHNAPTEEHLKKTHENFFKTFRKLCPETPVVMISAPNIKFWLDWTVRREIIKTTYNNALANGDKNVYFIDGEKLWGDDNWDCCTMDCIHPNDMGHFKMAQAILPSIKKLISR